MSLQSVVLTGVTGNVGAMLLEYLLEGGMTVNAVLRSFANSKEFLEQRYPHEVATGKLRFPEIPDMGIEGVFDAPAKNASAIIHVATPLSDSDFKAIMIEPAWQIDHSILEAANRSSTVKRVIVTGSIVAVVKLPEDLLKDETFNEENYNPITLEEAVTNEYMAKEDRSFDLVLLLAPSIIGRSIQQGFKANKDGIGGMSSLYNNLFDRDAVGSIFPFVMDVDDVARTHVKSLQTSAVPGNMRYLLIGGEMGAAQLANKLRANYPKLQSRVPAGGKEEPWPKTMAKCDISRSEKIFGSNWVSWWDSARATVEDILAYEANHPVVV